MVDVGLVKQVNTYIRDNEEEAIKLIEQFKEEQLTGGYTLTKSGYVLKTKKSKGEVVDSWTVVTVERTFSD